MTLDQLHRRDTRIAELEALGRARSRDQDHELGELTSARIAFWRRLPDQFGRAFRKARELEAYARQHRLPLDGVA